MEQNQINIIDKIPNFKFSIREWKAKTIKSGQEVSIDSMSNYRQDAVLVFYTSQNEYVELSIYWNLSLSTKNIELNWENFKEKELDEIAAIFNLQIVVNKDGNLYLNVQDYANYSATFCIKKSEQTDNYFMTIYYYDDGESRRNPKLYVHGVWEVALSDNLSKKIFG